MAATNKGARVKYITLLVILAGSGLAFLSSTQSWFSVRLSSVAGHVSDVAVPGSTAAPALTALALAGLALTAAFAIAGPIIRVVLGILGLLLGGVIIISTVNVIGDPISSSASSITTATGIAGGQSTRALVESLDSHVWPWFALAGGVLIALACLWVLFSVRRWPGPSHKYQTQFVPVASNDSSNVSDEVEDTADPRESSRGGVLSRDAAIDSWDYLTRGDDPTR